MIPELYLHFLLRCNLVFETMNLSYRISNYALRSIAAVTLPKSMRRSIRRVWILGVLHMISVIPHIFKIFN